jgi:hypothetical protein
MIRYLYHGAWLWWHQRRRLHHATRAEQHESAWNFHRNLASRPRRLRQRVRA